MKKKIGILLAIMILVTCLTALFTIIAIAEESQESQDTITISYVESLDTTSTTSSLDKTAYEGGKQTVKAGEKFTLPTTSSNTYTGQEGFQLVWYTEDGRTYKAGEAVAFDEDTKLFRCVAKECYTIADVNYAMTNESKAAILMSDITTSTGIDVKDQDMSALVLNGFAINMTRNGDIMGNQRSGKQIIGEGTLNVTSTDGKVGSYYVINCQGHGYNGTKNKAVIGRDVTINAPDFWLAQDWDGTNPHYPWIRIYGNVDVYGIMNISATGTRTQLVEIFENAVVKINGPTLYKNIVKSTNTQYYYNYHAIQTRIYGGTFYLPAEAENLSFWSDEYIDEYVDGTITYSPNAVAAANKDIIKISGGSFVLPDNKVPAIADFLTEDIVQAMQTGGNGLVTNNSESTYSIPFHNVNGFKLVFSKYTSPTPAKLLVYDFVGNKTEYRYETTKTEDGKAIATITIYEASTVTNDDGTTTTVYETVTDDFSFVPGQNGLFEFKNAVTSADFKLQSFEANDIVYQTVVPAGCEHNFEGAPVDATCNNAPYANYVCSVCGHSVNFTWGEKLEHQYVLGNHVQATATSLGSKSYACSLCGDAKTVPYSLDPSSLEIAVTIKHDDDTLEEITVLASEIFDFAASGSNGDYIYTLSAIKAFGDYKIRNIYGVTIPQGIIYVNILTHNYEKYNNVEYGLVELNIADGANVYLQNIGNLRKVEKITVGKNADVTFGASCSYYNPNNERRDMQKIATIDLSAGNHNVVFMNNAFNGRGAVANLIFGENSSYEFYYRAFYNCAITELEFSATNTYSFGQESFCGNDMTELIFPNNLDMAFGQSAFQSCPNLASVKFGENATYSIGNFAFRYSPIAKVVFTANSTYTVGQQAFVNSVLEEIDMSAGNMTVTLNNSAFNCWLDNKQAGAVTSIKFGENSTYVINEAAFNNVLVTELKLAPNSSYTFKKYFINGENNKTTFTTFDASANNITLLIEGEAFRNHKTVFTNLLINGGGSTYTFNGSAFYDTAISEITLGKGSTYTFHNCFNGSTPLAKVDASADNLNVTVNNWAWGRGTLATVLINGKNGTYTFNNEAFRSSIFTELVLGEGSTYNFNSGCYSSTNNLKKIDASADNITMTVANNVFNGKSAIEALDISGKNSTYFFGQECFKNSKIVEIKLGEGSSYEFGYYCFRDSSAITTLDFTASNVTAKFGNQAFDGRNTIAYIAFGENSTYTIGDYAFRNAAPTNDIVFSNTSTFKIGREAFRYADFASITFEDNCEVEFTGVDAFKDCDKATSLYIGENIAITNYPFRNLKALEALYIMEGVTHSSEYEFEYAGSSSYATPLYVYNHSYDLVFNKGMFKECDGIFLYTVTDNIGTNNEVFANCGDTNGYKAWTVYLGIPHPMVEGFLSAPNCTEEGVTGWVSDTSICNCDFKIAEDTVVNKYEKVHNISESTTPADSTTYAVTIAAPLGHDYGVEAPVRIDWIYVDNNYFANAKNKHNCTVCGVDYLGKDIENSALFVKKGTTVSEYGNDALGHVIFANLEAVDAYNAFLGEGNEIKYGVVAGLASQDGKPVNNDGSVNGKAFAFAFDGTEFSILQLKITGITNEEQGLYCCSYIIVDGAVSYLHNETVKSTATAVSLANPDGIEATEQMINVEAVVDSKETVYA